MGPAAPSPGSGSRLEHGGLGAEQDFLLVWCQLDGAPICVGGAERGEDLVAYPEIRVPPMRAFCRFRQAEGDPAEGRNRHGHLVISAGAMDRRSGWLEGRNPALLFLCAHLTGFGASCIGHHGHEYDPQSRTAAQHRCRRSPTLSMMGPSAPSRRRSGPPSWRRRSRTTLPALWPSAAAPALAPPASCMWTRSGPTRWERARRRRRTSSTTPSTCGPRPACPARSP